MVGVQVSAPRLVTAILTLPSWFCRTTGFGTGFTNQYEALYGECVTNSRGGLAVAWPVNFFQASESVTDARTDRP